LKQKRVELFPRDTTYKDMAAFEGWFKTVWIPFTQRVPEESRNEFVDEICNKYVAKYPPDAEGMIHVGMVRLEVEAEN